MPLLLPKHLMQKINAYLEETYPEEGCGFLLGYLENNAYILKGIYPVPNVWEKKEERKRRYSVAPEDFLKAEKEAQRQNLLLIGIYHSHPDYPPSLSEFDKANSWPDFIYLIVSLHRGKAQEAKAYLFNSHREFRELAIQITEEVKL